MSEKIIWTERTVQLSDLQPYERNPRIITADAYERLRADIEEFGYHDRIKCQPGSLIIGGHQRLRALRELKFTEVPILEPSRPLTFEEYRKLLIKDNLPYGSHDWNILASDFEREELEDWGMPASWFGDDEKAEGEKDENQQPTVSLADRFGIPPFSVFNAREGWWQARKFAWVSQGIESELGRNAPAGGSPDLAARQNGESGTSIFDPVLCELAYQWFCPKGGSILDPFAGGSVRGIVAGMLGREYTGIDLRTEQVDANIRQSEKITMFKKPKWIVGDSAIFPHDSAPIYDFVFSCPPYADLEVYSDNPKDLSTMKYADFITAYRQIISNFCGALKDNRFACFVVGEVRDGKGNYRNFVGDTVEAFKNAGLKFYNEAILVTPCGSAALRAGNSFTQSRKFGKTHQNVLVFVKGDAKKATEAIGEVEFGEVDQSPPVAP